MTEAAEVARNMLPNAPRFDSIDAARRYVRLRMPSETETIVDNVAFELFELRAQEHAWTR